MADGAEAAGLDHPISVSLPYRPPFPAAALLGFLGARAIPGVEEVPGSTYRRSLGPAVLELTPMPAVDAVRLEVSPEDLRDLPAVVRAARGLFDLGVDPDAVARTLERDPVLRPLVRAHRGIRLPAAADGFELVVRAIVGQQISVAAARTMLGHISARFGTALEGDGSGITTRFPGPGRLSDAPLEELGVTGRRAGTIRRVAGMVAGAELDLSVEANPDETTRRLLEVDGIGPWTAEYVRMRALHDPDAFVAGDLGVRHGFVRLGLDATPRAILARAEAWRPFRAYATMLLWQAVP